MSKIKSAEAIGASGPGTATRAGSGRRIRSFAAPENSALEDEVDNRDADEALAEARIKGTRSLAEVKKELGL